ncbi:hypothetical protein [Pseudomonas aeruginosa]|uniref:hypothetical protein n=1 Tax=Pseudomonas aeruginosa TaxID=287 RepID=UPI0026659CB7|nr:hypothetical protein [Pseudomonas aeruginosa]MDO2217574.1 hypothetical protein [Pseudomonas aeruginosa]
MPLLTRGPRAEAVAPRGGVEEALVEAIAVLPGSLGAVAGAPASHGIEARPLLPFGHGAAAVA